MYLRQLEIRHDREYFHQLEIFFLHHPRVFDYQKHPKKSSVTKSIIGHKGSLGALWSSGTLPYTAWHAPP